MTTNALGGDVVELGRRHAEAGGASPVVGMLPPAAFATTSRPRQCGSFGVFGKGHKMSFRRVLKNPVDAGQDLEECEAVATYIPVHGLALPFAGFVS